MHIFKRPEEACLFAVRDPVSGPCPECNSESLEAYRLLSEGGWWNVVKCSNCLHSISREPGPLFGSFAPLAVPQ